MQCKSNLTAAKASSKRSDQSCSTAGFVLVVIPALNEAEHIDGLITQLLADAGEIAMKIVVADGGSTDDTRAIVQGIMRRDSRVALLDNKKHIAAAAVNCAVTEFGEGAEFLIRIDAHAEYPSHFCARLLAVQFDTAANSVVVTMLTMGPTCFQRAVAAAQNSPLGNGGAPHRNAPKGRWVDHGHHALMRIAVFKAVGGYDELFHSNEDAELDVRLRANGFRIYLAGPVSIVYYPRRSIQALFRQYFNYGRGRARNFLKHRQIPILRQIIPLAVAPALGVLFLAPMSAAFAIPALLWSLSCIGYGILLGIGAGDACASLSGIAAMTMHAGWSLGFFKHLLVDAPRDGRVARNLSRQKRRINRPSPDSVRS